MATHISLNSNTLTLTHGIVLSSMDQPLSPIPLTHSRTINQPTPTILSISLACRTLPVHVTMMECHSTKDNYLSMNQHRAIFHRCLARPRISLSLAHTFIPALFSLLPPFDNVVAYQ